MWFDTWKDIGRVLVVTAAAYALLVLALPAERTADQNADQRADRLTGR
jgi:hypothetical protein